METLTNNSGLHGIVQYTISPVSISIGCPGADFTVNVTVGSVPASPGTISGPAIVCQLSSTTYSIAPVPEATSYIWTVPSMVNSLGVFSGMTITSGQGGTTINVSTNVSVHVSVSTS